MAKQKKGYTILFVPEDRGSTFSVHLPTGALRFLIGVALLIIVGCLTLLYVSGEIALKLQVINSLRVDNEILRAENKRLHSVVDNASAIVELGSYLERIVSMHEDGDSISIQKPIAFISENEIIESEEIPVIIDSHTHHHHGSSRARAIANQINHLPTIHPVEGWITRGFGALYDSLSREKHIGLDYAATTGTLIRATAPGIVVSVKQDRFLGKLLELDHGAGIQTRFGHCQQILVAVGERVQRGQTIALVGNTGRSSAPHLHYEIIKDGQQVDPLTYILDR